MPKEDIRRYSLEQIREMNRRGEFTPTPPDAPVYELSKSQLDAFAGKTHPTLPRRVVVELEISPETFETFRAASSDPHRAMAQVLEQHAARKTPKAS